MSALNSRITIVLQVKTVRGNFTSFLEWENWRWSCWTLRPMTVWIHVSRWNGSQVENDVRLKFRSNGALCRAKTLYTTCVKLKGFSSRRLSLRLIFGTSVQRSFHLFDKMLVTTASSVDRKERMWQIRESDRLLILSMETTVS